MLSELQFTIVTFSTDFQSVLELDDWRRSAQINWLEEKCPDRQVDVIYLVWPRDGRIRTDGELDES